ncbi:MAG: hypothetical protein J5621_09300 [Paludibacteraceae bacterium]|nr:hypothetical protein [Paludibacteraceae bacterium]
METKKPTNILDAIFYGVEVTNQNLLTLSENMNDMYNKIVAMREQVDAIKAFFYQPAPEKPTTSGEDGAVTESRKSDKIS